MLGLEVVSAWLTVERQILKVICANADAAWDGIKAYLTNTTLNKEEVIANYGNLWYIERAFRMNKSDLRVRPIYHRLRNRIEGHICICFTAYAVLLELERILKATGSPLTLARVREAVKTMYRLNYVSPNTHKPMSVLLQMACEHKQV
jgi:transposase